MPVRDALWMGSVIFFGLCFIFSGYCFIRENQKGGGLWLMGAGVTIGAMLLLLGLDDMLFEEPEHDIFGYEEYGEPLEPEEPNDEETP